MISEKDAYGHRSQERGHDAAARQQIHQPAQSSPKPQISFPTPWMLKTSVKPTQARKAQRQGKT